jgi:ABC-type histidine transport system ATPase subunit
MSNKELIYWKQRNGELIDIDKMDINHLRNVLKMIVKNSNNHKVGHLTKHLGYRFIDDELRGNQWN